VIVLLVPECAAEHAETGRSRIWEEALAAVRQAVPGAVQLHPGSCAMRARGPARYYRGEAAAGAAILEHVKGVAGGRAAPGATVGIASGRFTAQLAARMAEDHPGLHSPHPGVRVVDESDTAAFLAPVPVSWAADEALAETLIALGAHTLGVFAGFPEHTVLQRFGASALAAHRRARGLGELHADEVPRAAPVHDFAVEVEFDPPLDGDDQLAFACVTHADGFIRALHGAGLVCTVLRVELCDDTGARHERSWSHPTSFTATDAVSRARWQAADLPRDPARGGAGISAVRFSPERTVRASTHEPGLWNTAPNERVHHQLTRVQSMVGYDGVATGLLTGGRTSVDRHRLSSWGDDPGLVITRARPADGPWPGSLVGAVPALHFAEPAPVELRSAAGSTVSVDDDELLSERPATFYAQPGRRVHDPRSVCAWSAPWPLHERWWAGGERVYRLQLLLDDGEAWLLRYDPAIGWSAEGVYS
jgi:protein ImuB